jgi:hypothetical protein
MDQKDKPSFHAAYHVTAIKFLLIGIITTCTSASKPGIEE